MKTTVFTLVYLCVFMYVFTYHMQKLEFMSIFRYQLQFYLLPPTINKKSYFFEIFLYESRIVIFIVNSAKNGKIKSLLFYFENKFYRIFLQTLKNT